MRFVGFKIRGESVENEVFVQKRLDEVIQLPRILRNAMSSTSGAALDLPVMSRLIHVLCARPGVVSATNG